MYFDASIRPNAAPLAVYHRCAATTSVTPERFARS
jgi:hypothetical protein